MPETALIAIDWGTSSLRAWRMDHAGEIFDRRRDSLGILKVEGADFSAAFDRVIGDWTSDAAAAPVLMAGMIGSRQGWIEAAYVPCPASVELLAQQLTPVPERRNLKIVPGLSLRPKDAAPDVMRGEETQIFGLDAEGDALVILPGTHSKWVSLRGGVIDWFATFMTGEVYDVLKRHSILGRMMEEPQSSPGIPPAFAAGAAAAQTGRSGTLQSLFSVRTRALFGELTPQDAAGYLSGLLIGNEIREGLAAMKARGADPRKAILIGAEALTPLYAFTLDQAGIASVTAGEECSAHGLFRIARMAGLIARG